VYAIVPTHFIAKRVAADINMLSNKAELVSLSPVSAAIMSFFLMLRLQRDQWAPLVKQNTQGRMACDSSLDLY